MRRAETEHPGYQLLGPARRALPDGNGYPFDAFAVAYASLEDLRAELQFFSFPTGRRTSATSSAAAGAEIAADDYGALQPLYDAGLIPRSTQSEFGEGVSIFDRTGHAQRRWHGSSSTGEKTTASASRSHRRETRFGTGVEQFRFADGADLLTADMLGLAQPFQVRATQGDDILVYTDATTSARVSAVTTSSSARAQRFLDGGAGNDISCRGAGLHRRRHGRRLDRNPRRGTVVAFNPGDATTRCTGERPLRAIARRRRGPGGPLPARGRRGTSSSRSASGDSIRLTRQLEADP